MTAPLVQVVVALFLCGFTSAFAPTTTQIMASPVQTASPSSSTLRVPSLASPLPTTRRGVTVLRSAKILPVAYTGIGATLIVRAVQATTRADAAVLAATGAIALFNLGPTDNARLASAKKAYANTPPASSGKAKQLRQAAKTWRSVVRIKLVGQFGGLIWMAVAASSNGILRGAATVMAANMAFFLCGAGGATHNSKGEFAPMPTETARSILTMNTILVAAALAAARAPLLSTRRHVLAGIYAVMVGIGAIEGMVLLVQRRKGT